VDRSNGAKCTRVGAGEEGFGQLEGGYAGFDGHGEVEVLAAGVAEDGDGLVRPVGGEEGTAESPERLPANLGTRMHLGREVQNLSGTRCRVTRSIPSPHPIDP